MPSAPECSSTVVGRSWRCPSTVESELAKRSHGAGRGTAKGPRQGEHNQQRQGAPGNTACSTCRWQAGVAQPHGCPDD
eukprot:12550618-Alexandrium_andersonii.AAC.1